MNSGHRALAECGVSACWAMPAHLSGDLDVRALRTSQGLRSGLTAILGNWPGDDETGAQIEEALQSI